MVTFTLMQKDKFNRQFFYRNENGKFLHLLQSLIKLSDASIN
jgi:hypothetical protein